MFEDRKPLATFLIGVAMGFFFVLTAIAAIAPAEPLGTQVTLYTVNMVGAILASIFLVGGILLALPLIKEDKDVRMEIMLYVILTLIFVLAFAIVSAL